jgi:hypothetical protein
MQPIERFLIDVDDRWALSAPTKLRLRVIGSAALMLQTDYARGTKDSDILETASLSAQTKSLLLQLAGKGSDLHTRHRLYLEIVPSGLPFLPQVPHWHLLTDLNNSLKHFEIEVLDVVDVVVSKLKRFNANDQSDVEAMIAKDLVPHGQLVARFQSAVDVYGGDARADDLPGYVKRLNRVERDMFGVAETEIELPSWIG